LKNVIEWLNINRDSMQVFSAILQSISAVLLFIVTVIYVRLTYKMVHEPFKAIVKPMRWDISEANSIEKTIKVKNYGPGMAINLKMKALSFGEIIKLSNKPICERVFIESEGDAEVVKDGIANMVFKARLVPRVPIQITWETTTGKKSMSYYIINRITTSEFIELRGFKRLIYWRIWFSIQIKKPYYIILKRQKEKKVLSDIMQLYKLRGKIDRTELADTLRIDYDELELYISKFEKRNKFYN